MIVSLEAIFLSTFVMISQNRADAKRQIVADQQWTVVQVEDKQNDRAARPLASDPRAHEAGPRNRESPAESRAAGAQFRSELIDSGA